MSRSGEREWLGDDLDMLLQQLGGELESAVELTGTVSSRQRKAVFRVNLKDGRVFKARRFKTLERCRSVIELMPILEEFPFPRIVASSGLSAIEEWIEGTPVQLGDVTAEQARRAGTVLGQLHTVASLPPNLLAQMPDLEWHSSRISAHLAVLVESGGLPSAVASRLQTLAEESRPTTFSAGLVHGDFCADNFVISTDGELCVIDNESLHIDALDYDLARCWSLWPMSRQVRQAFTAGYEYYRSLETVTAYADFWSIRALCKTAHSKVRHHKPCAQAMEALIRVGKREMPWGRP